VDAASFGFAFSQSLRHREIVFFDQVRHNERRRARSSSIAVHKHSSFVLYGSFYEFDHWDKVLMQTFPGNIHHIEHFVAEVLWKAGI
jgi:hypothetical protein